MHRLKSFNNVTIICSMSENREKREGLWSGEATRNRGLAVDDTSVKISFAGEGDDAATAKSRAPKDRPIWLTSSTIIDNAPSQVCSLSQFLIFFKRACPITELVNHLMTS